MISLAWEAVINVFCVVYVINVFCVVCVINVFCVVYGMRYYALCR